MLKRVRFSVVFYFLFGFRSLIHVFRTSVRGDFRLSRHIVGHIFVLVSVFGCAEGHRIHAFITTLSIATRMQRG